MTYIILLPLSSFLFMLGGYRWKGWRRFVLPLCFSLVCFIYSVTLWQILLLGLFGYISFSLPYGENSLWIQRVVTAITFGLIGISLGFDWLMVVPPIVFIVGWILSNMAGLQWKIVEAITGLVIALPIANRLYYG